jgi:ribosomal protein S18 acetylase RimI-like enzyme
MADTYRVRPASDADEEFIRALRRRNFMHNAPILRIAGQTAAEVIDAMEDWTDRSLDGMGDLDSIRITVAETEAGEVVGYLMLLWPAMDDFSQLPQGYVYDVGVVRQHWGMDVGALLIKDAEDHVREQGGAFIQLNVNAQNGRAVEFYRKNGYIEEWKVLGKCLIGPES